MGRLLHVLIPILFVTAAIAGCIGGEEEPTPPLNGNGDGGDDVNGNQTNGNQTVEPAAVPVPQIDVQVSIGGNESSAPFIAPPGSAVDFEFDGSASSVADGEIEVYVWSVVRPNGDEVRGTPGDDPTFSFGINGTANPLDYGVYTATLRVLSEKGAIAETTKLFALSMTDNRATVGHIVGPAPSGCDWDRQNAAGGPVAHTEELPFGPLTVDGTYNAHSVSVGKNATTLNLALTHASEDSTAEVKLYVFDPNTELEDSNCGDAIAESESDSSSVSLSVEDLEPGTYKIRVQLIGLAMGPYSLDMSVLYAVPGDSGDDGDADDDEDEDDEDDEEEE
jgi:hypothetical protein